MTHNGQRYLVVVSIVAFSIATLGTSRAQEGGLAVQSPATSPADGTSPRSVWNGVYTEAQAERGHELYATHCVMCHGESLEGGGSVHALVGAEFAANWNGLSMGDLLDRTRTTMPMNKPGTLSRQQIADLLAFVLRVNKFPAGATELPRQAELLAQITFLSTKPSSDLPRGKP